MVSIYSRPLTEAHATSHIQTKTPFPHIRDEFIRIEEPRDFYRQNQYLCPTRLKSPYCSEQAIGEVAAKDIGKEVTRCGLRRVRRLVVRWVQDKESEASRDNWLLKKNHRCPVIRAFPGSYFQHTLLRYPRKRLTNSLWVRAR